MTDEGRAIPVTMEDIRQALLDALQGICEPRISGNLFRATVRTEEVEMSYHGTVTRFTIDVSEGFLELINKHRRGKDEDA